MTQTSEKTESLESCDERVIHPERIAAARRTMPAMPMFDRLAEFFSALGQPSRLRILQALSSQQLCVCDLATLLAMSESAVSHQLRHLRSLRLVRSRREGKLVYYDLDDDHVHQLISTTIAHLEE